MLKFSVFDSLDETTAQTVANEAQTHRFGPQDFVLREGDVNDHLFLIEAGELAVVKSVGNSSSVEVARLTAGDCFGEMSALTGAAASASLQAIDNATVRSTRLAAIADAAVRSEVTANIARILIGRLSSANEVIGRNHEQKLKAMRRQISAADFVTKTIILVSIYMIVEPFAAYLNARLQSASVLSSIIILMFFFGTFRFYRKSGLPAATFGMDTAALGDKLRIGILWSLPFIAVLIVAKLIGAWIAPGRMHLIEPDNVQSVLGPGQTSLALYALAALFYMALTFAQEFIRCSVQSSIDLFKTNDDVIHRTWTAMLVADTIFAALHSHLGGLFAFAAFVTGLFWGWMYMRTGSYWASAFSHALVGAVGIFVLGVPG